MRYDFPGSQPQRQSPDPANPLPRLALDIIDQGADAGLDVAIRDESSGHILFETVLADPESRILLTFGSLETESFWQCLRTHRCVNHIRHLLITARCRFSILPTATASKRRGQTEMRNARFLRLIEALVDELQTREPAMSVEVAVTHRNPAFAKCINY